MATYVNDTEPRNGGFESPTPFEGWLMRDVQRREPPEIHVGTVDGLAPDTGNRYLRIGYNGNIAESTTSLEPFAALIDAGGVNFAVDLVYGMTNSTDTGEVRLICKDSSGTTLASSTSGELIPAAVDTWYDLSVTVAAPVNTRFLVVQIEGIDLDGFSNDFCVDSVVISTDETGINWSLSPSLQDVEIAKNSSTATVLPANSPMASVDPDLWRGCIHYLRYDQPDSLYDLADPTRDWRFHDSDIYEYVVTKHGRAARHLGTDDHQLVSSDKGINIPSGADATFMFVGTLHFSASSGGFFRSTSFSTYILCLADGMKIYWSSNSIVETETTPFGRRVVLHFVVRSNKDAEIWVDGVMVAQDTHTKTTSAFTTEQIGASYVEQLAGDYETTAMWTRALSPGEIARLAADPERMHRVNHDYA